MAEKHLPDFAELLRRARRAANLSQEELAERAGVSVRAISALERGVNRAPRRDTLDMLADALELPADERQHWERLRRRQSTRTHAPETAVRAGTQRIVTAPPNNLPLQPTRFFGREHELALLTAMLRETTTRLITLSGPGGSGKTRLALEIAATLRAQYPDGTYFVDLSPISDPTLALRAVATTVGLRSREDQPVSMNLADWIADKRLLLVLDNLEQVLAVAPDIGELLQRCGALQILATSRAPLRLRAEREFPVPPLPLPPVDHRAGAPGAEDYDAVRLFIDRARAIRPDFEATSKETRDIARICRQLDGLPLAIELAAASVRLFPPKAILERLEQHLPLVAGSHRDTPARQRTLRETIAWSYDLLGPNEQRLLRRLSLFKGGWTLEAAEAVAGTDAVTAAPIDVLLATETLIEHSLIQSRTWLDGSPRFSMLETIREFGLEQLNAHEETNETHRRHAKFLMELFAGSENAWHTPRAHRWMQRGDVERENVRLALAWAISGAPGTALRLACEIAGYCSNRGAELESLRWLEQALASAGDIPDDLRAGALVWIGWHATTLGDFEKAHGANEAALAIYRRLGDYPGAAHCLFGLARNAFWACDFDQAVLLYEDTAAQFRRHDDSVLVTALGNLGWALIENGMLDRAAVVLDEALCRVEPGTTPGQRSVITTAQGQIALERGDLPGARHMLKVSVELEREGQDPRSIAQVLETCAWLSAAEGDAAHMARILGAVSALRKTIGVPVPPMMQRRYDRYVPIAQAQISAAEWEQAWSEGHALSTADAIELALQKLV